MHASKSGVTPRSLIAWYVTAIFDDAEWLQSDLQNEIADVLCVELVCQLCATMQSFDMQFLIPIAVDRSVRHSVSVELR